MRDSGWMTSGALLDFAERSRAQREPRSARNPLSLKAVLPTDRCKATERRKTTKHVRAMQVLVFCVPRLQHPDGVSRWYATFRAPDRTFDGQGAVGRRCSSRV